MTRWRTRTVLGLCEGMREARDYTAAPILADALEDAEYPRPDVLGRLREPLPAWEAERLVAEVYSDESAAAVGRIDALAAEMGECGYPSERDDLPPMTYERLMAAARLFAATGDDGLVAGSMHWSNVICDREDQFWADYQSVTGSPAPGDHDAFLSCHC